MSASGAVATTRFGFWELDLRGLRIARYATGSTIAMAVAMGFNWNLSFLVPVLSLSFFSTPAPRPTLKAGVSFVAVITVACVAGLAVVRYLIPYPAIFFPIAGLLLLRIFHAMSSGKAPLLYTWLMLALLLIPMVALESVVLARGIAFAIAVGAVATILVVWLTYGLLPDPPSVLVEEAQQAKKPTLVPDVQERFETAVLSTIVVFPVMAIFFLFQWSGGLLVLIFIALLSSQPAFAKNLKMGTGLVLGNAIGGLAAIITYELLVIVPELGFLVLLTFLAGLVFGTRVFSGKATAPVFNMAFSTVLLIIGMTTGMGGDAGAKVYTRIAQVMVAVVYVVAAFSVAEKFTESRRA